jgi:putative addiction module component (TIGR02574 family)
MAPPRAERQRCRAQRVEADRIESYADDLLHTARPETGSVVFVGQERSRWPDVRRDTTILKACVADEPVASVRLRYDFGTAPETEARRMSEQELEAAALKLPSHERARLAEVLIASLDEEDEIARAWADEAERRYEELRTGAVEAVPAEDVISRIRSRLG